MLRVTDPEASRKDKQGPPGHVRAGPWWFSPYTVWKESSERRTPLPVKVVDPTAAGQAVLDLRAVLGNAPSLGYFPVRIPWLRAGLRKGKAEIKGKQGARGSSPHYHQDGSLHHTSEQVTPETVT